MVLLHGSLMEYEEVGINMALHLSGYRNRFLRVSRSFLIQDFVNTLSPQSAPVDMFYKTTFSIACILVATQAQQATNCQYQSLKCGSALLASPYSLSFPA